MNRRWIEVASCVPTRCLAKKLEDIAVKLSSSRLADRTGDDAAVVVSVLGIEVRGEDAELFDGVGDWAGMEVPPFHVPLDVDSVDHESVWRIPAVR